MEKGCLRKKTEQKKVNSLLLHKKKNRAEAETE
jgi:hypothetical protein